MSDLRCPKMDRLGRQLIDTYRRREELISQQHTLKELSAINEDMERLHQSMSMHRSACVFCKKYVRVLRREPSVPQGGSAQPETS
jgi:hypothetical protein